MNLPISTPINAMTIRSSLSACWLDTDSFRSCNMSWSTYNAGWLGRWALGGYQQTPDRTHLNSRVQEVDPLGNL